jgi:hypothetical protein
MHRSKFVLFLFVFTFSLFSFSQNQKTYPQRPPLPVQPPYGNYQALEQQYGSSFPGRDTWNGQGAGPAVLSDRARWAAAQAQYQDAEARKRQHKLLLAQSREPQAHADPEAPDQSELLKNSKDHDFILHNFRTMYIDASEAKFFSADLVKAALGRSKEFQKLKVRIVDDPRVADAVLKITYSFAWDFPFELRHQNTTYVLLAGKGEGPFYGPLGAADVARQFVKAAKPWREKAASK